MFPPSNWSRASSLSPLLRPVRPQAHASTLVSDELPGETSPDSVLTPQGFANLGDFKLPDSKKSKMEQGAAARTPVWAIAEEFRALDQQGALLEGGGGSDAAPPSPQSDFSLPGGVTSNHSRTADFFMRTQDGFLCSKTLTSEDLLMLETGVGAKHGSLCKLFFGPKPAPKLVKTPRGFKSTEHLENLRQSNPCYGSLAPNLTRPNCAEVSYDPLKRFRAIGDKVPRGYKSTEHLEILRTSDPCYGTLAPALRGSRAEYSFDPRKRFAALAWTSREPRGSKTAAHLAVLRTSDPTYGTLAPSRTRPAPAALVSSLAAVGMLEGMTRVVSVDGLDGWQNITPDAEAPALAEQVPPAWPEEQSDDEADDEADSGDALPELQGWGSRRRRPRASSASFDSDQASMARTADRDWNEPRASNDTIASFMDDNSDGHASGEWAGYQMSPRKSKSAKGGKLRPALEGPAEDGPKHPGNAAAWAWTASSH